MHSNLDAIQTTISVALRRGPRRFHSVAKQASFCVALRAVFIRFWRGFVGFWRPKSRSKSILERFFFEVFCERLLASILVGFLEARTLKNHQKPLVFQWFSLIFAKSSFSQNISKNVDLGFIFGSQKEEKSIKMVFKSMSFFDADF